ncbi:MAG: biopolymer transporter ExbD [Salinimicrobium sediminis]|uniref:Biopolymer transport protein ExbD n=1 Tax=Salinimicrobium sediminis TaxID=1343891 RepID=A0A285X335_9FLAO|nr:biopolymer transporter ExbD [Salinimicrobium sediminis]MDX1602328.1 biopolymer transporter ExbD [Salinimicrobium sediminis]MDX1752851.1 biopolymer transporter ExbD [Salinimicrobium sediminis]SOC79722.1 Biopolymer transport protein ExbD [Salinimicrobium sediminis]
MARRSTPEVNAGSLADIAFLLLIFFLVTTTIETDSGISRKLPPMQDEEVVPPVIKEKNIFQVIVNRNNDLLVEDELMELSELREAAKAFLDNGGGVGPEACDYCEGAGDPTSSDNPVKAVIMLVNDRQTEYGTYIAVQNELVGAYNELRDRTAQRMFGKSFQQMEADFNDVRYTGNKDRLKEQIEQVRDMWPQKLSEADPKN